MYKLDLRCGDPPYERLYWVSIWKNFNSSIVLRNVPTPVYVNSVIEILKEKYNATWDIEESYLIFENELDAIRFKMEWT